MLEIVPFPSELHVDLSSVSLREIARLIGRLTTSVLLTVALTTLSTAAFHVLVSPVRRLLDPFL